jgi:hypothetical protein
VQSAGQQRISGIFSVGASAKLQEHFLGSYVFYGIKKDKGRMEPLIEAALPWLGRTVRYLVIDLLIDVLLYWLGYGVLALLKIVTFGYFPAKPLSQQSTQLKVSCGVAALLLLFSLMMWLI